MARRIGPDSTGGKSWLFMRGSAFLMPSLVLGHLIIQHLLNDVHDLKLEWVAERWNTAGWRIYDGLMLVLAVGHGLNGTRNVIDDYIHDPDRNRAAHTGIQILGTVLVVVGLVGLIAFDKETALEKLG